MLALTTALAGFGMSLGASNRGYSGSTENPIVLCGEEPGANGEPSTATVDDIEILGWTSSIIPVLDISQVRVIMPFDLYRLT